MYTPLSLLEQTLEKMAINFFFLKFIIYDLGPIYMKLTIAYLSFENDNNK